MNRGSYNKKGRIAGAIAGASILLGAAVASAAEPPAITALRVGQHPGMTRVVLDITKPTDLGFEISADGRAIFLDLPEADWRAKEFAAEHAKGFLVDYRFGTNAEGRGRLSLLAARPIKIKRPFFVPPGGGRGHRVVVDILPAGPAERADLAFESARPPVEPVSARSIRRPDAPARNEPPELAVADREMTVPRAELVEEPETAEEVAQSNMPANPPAPRGQTPVMMPAGQNGGPFANKGLYLKGGAGLSFVRDSDLSGSGNINTTEFDTGFNFMGGVGLDLQNNFRLEADAILTTNSIQSMNGTANGITVSSANIEGNVTTLSFFGGGAYDIKNQSVVTPFLLGGVGLTGVFLNDVKSSGSALYDDSTFVFGLQLGGGVSMDITDRTTLELSYRFIESQDAEIGDASGDAVTVEHSSHNFILGARHKF